MARYYKTASAMPLDYMYKINAPLMEKVLLANDDMIDENLNQLDKYNSVIADFKYLSPDEGRAKQITDEYTKQIESVSDTIRKDPANWRKQLDPIRSLGKDLVNNYKTGEISKIVGNYNQYKSASDYIDKELENYNKDGKGGISADRAKTYKQYFLNEFVKKDPNGTAYNPKTGTYNAINTFNPMANMDVRKVLSDELDKIKADKNSYKVDKVTGQEWYFNTEKQVWEGVTPDKILGIATSRLQDPQLKNYLKENSQVGLINGVFDEDGEYINPYTVNSVDPSPEEQNKIKLLEDTISKTKDSNIRQQLQTSLDTYKSTLNSKKNLQWNNQSYLAPILRGITSQYSYSQTEGENTLRNNSMGSTKFIQAQTNQRQRLTLAQQKAIADVREKGLNDRFKERLDFDKYKWDNPHTKDAKDGSGTGGKKPKEEPPTESTVSKLATNSFEDWTTQDVTTGQKVKVLSNAGLSSDISRLRDQEKEMRTTVTKLTNAMGGFPVGSEVYNQIRVQKEALEKQLPQIQSDLNSRRKWYEASVNAALTNNPSSLKDSNGEVGAMLTPAEVALYKKYDGDRGAKKIQEFIGQGASEYLFKSLNTGELGTIGKWLGDKNDPQYQLRKEYTDYLNIKNKVDTRRDNFLAQMRYTPIDTDAIQVGNKEAKDISQLIFSNPQGLKMYDATGNKADNIQLEGKGVSWFDPKGDNYKMTTVDDKNNLINYMLKHNVIPQVEQVGNTTKIGTGGAVVKLTFKDPNGEIPSTPFYVELTPELQKMVGSRLSMTKNPDVKKISDDILDSEANDIRRQLITPTVSRTAGATDNYDPVTNTIFINNGNQRVPFKVTKFVGSDGVDHLNITGTINGEEIALPNTPSGIPGWFNGAEDFIQYIKSHKNK